MIDGKTVLAVIPARGGSKGLPRKNVLEVGGKPMIVHSLETARRARYVDRTVLSTDDAEIAEVARRFGGDVPFMRPAELARDESPIDRALIHALDQMEQPYDYLVLLEPTTPLRTAADIDACIALCRARNAPACISVSEPPHSPYWTVTLQSDDTVKLLFGDSLLSARRQELPKAYMINGGVYVARVDWYREHRTFLSPQTLGYVMPPERSYDVDSRLDLMTVNMLLAGFQSTS